jgi:hypothetical protein
VVTEVWYRYFDKYSYENPEPTIQELPVVKHTPQGVILNFYGEHKFVLNSARRRWAYPTKELALDSYIQRKRKQMRHGENTVAHAKAMLFQAEAIQRGEVLPKPDRFKLFS